MMKKTNSQKDRFTILRVFLHECTISLALAGVYYLIKKYPLEECLTKSVANICLIFIVYLGWYMFEALVDNNWRIKLAEEQYPVVKSIILIIVNAVVFLLTAQYERSYAYFIVPLTAWLFAIVYTYYYKWKRRH